jgi:hypothetical protein
MRARVALLLACSIGHEASASIASGSSETLVGWSDDGQRYAVTGFRSDTSEFFLEVRAGDKVLGHWKEGDKGMPDGVNNTMGPDRIDVTTWDGTKKFGLKLITQTARKKFTAELVASSTTKVIDRYHCGPGGWSLKRNGKVLFTKSVPKDHCAAVLGGYLDASGTHALVKLREAWQYPSKETLGEKVTEENITFVAVELPRQLAP